MPVDLGRQLAAMRKELDSLAGAVAPEAMQLLDDIRRDGATMMSLAGMEPDPWQKDLLRSESKRILMLASRQSGKSQTASAIALREALLRPNALILILSPTLRQSSELFQARLLPLYQALGKLIPAAAMTRLTLTLANGSRIVCLPSNEQGVRCFSSVALLLIDEASRVSNALYAAVRPMLAVSGGKLICLSTPYGKLGFFHDCWFSSEEWQRVKITAWDCPRIPKSFLLQEHAALGERIFKREFECEFSDAIDAVFFHGDIMAAMSDDLEPLFVDSADDNDDKGEVPI